jgi:drug/metabolite transporter (DMT)-like permease
MQNLLSLNKKKQAYQVLAFSILYTALGIFLANISETPNTSINLVVNAVGGIILTEFFFKRNVPDESNLPKKKIWKALIISLLIMLPFAVALIYSLQS